MTKLVLDASVIISWCDELRDLSVMRSLNANGYQLVTTERVRQEVLREETTDLHECVLETVDIVEVSEERFNQFSAINPRLGQGEVSVLVKGEQLEKKSSDYFCVLDDKLARKSCKNLGCNLTGTLGLYNLLIDDGEITVSEADEQVKKMKENDSRLPENHIKLLGPDMKPNL